MTTFDMGRDIFPSTAKIQTVTMGRDTVETVTIKLVGQAPETLSINGMTYMADANGCFKILYTHAIQLSKTLDFRLASGERFVLPNPENYVELAPGESEVRVGGLVIWNGMKCMVRTIDAKIFAGRTGLIAVAETLTDRPTKYYQPAIKSRVKFNGITYEVIEIRRVTTDNAPFDYNEVREEVRSLRERVSTKTESIPGSSLDYAERMRLFEKMQVSQESEIMKAFGVTPADMVPITTATPIQTKPKAAERREMRLDEEIP